MKRFACEVCGGEVFFDSSECVRCGTPVGYVLGLDAVVPLEGRQRCANAERAGCTWLTDDGGLCESCALTRVRPADSDLDGLALFPVAEEAKRHLVRDLTRRGFPIVGKDVDEQNGLAFDLLSSVAEDVTIGHADGVITIDLAEGDDSYREKMRRQLAEPYRTMLGHFRHESGHYIEWQHVEGTPLIERARELFGDERVDYQEAIDRHYAEGPPSGWQQDYLSAYATMHPYEDFAETWAHVLHVHDTVETAVAFELIPPVAEDVDFRTLLFEVWMPLSTALNVVNRSLGQRDLYPFTLPDRVVEKMSFVASLRPGSSSPGP